MYYHVKFVSSAKKVVRHVRINIREPPKLGNAGTPFPCGRGVADPLERRPSPTCYPAEFGRSRSNGTSVIKYISAWKIWPSCPAFQGHWRL